MAGAICSAAFRNLAAALEIDKRLPEYVLRGEWAGFHLFDSDRMFEAAFVEKVIALLAIEGASCACLVNLDRESGSEQASFVVDERTTRDPYRDRLRGFGPGDGWLYEMNRFGCVSDKGSWCIYRERPSGLTIIGFRRSFAHEAFKPVPESLHAGRAASVVAGSASYELPRM